MADLKISSLIEDNGGCDLPCWWGIEPGVSHWSEEKDWLNQIADISYTSYINPRGVQQVIVGENLIEMVSGGQDFLLYAIFAIKDDTIMIIKLGKSTLGIEPNVTLPELLRIFGKPDEIKLLLPHPIIQIQQTLNPLYFIKTGVFGFPSFLRAGQPVAAFGLSI